MQHSTCLWRVKQRLCRRGRGGEEASFLHKINTETSPYSTFSNHLLFSLSKGHTNFLLNVCFQYKPGQCSWYSDQVTAWRIQGWNPGTGNRFFTSPQTRSEAHATSYSMRVSGSFRGENWVGHEVDHSPTPHAEVKNGWTYTSAPPVCLHDMDRDTKFFPLLSNLKKV